MELGLGKAVGSSTRQPWHVLCAPRTGLHPGQRNGPRRDITRWYLGELMVPLGEMGPDRPQLVTLCQGNSIRASSSTARG